MDPAKPRPDEPTQALQGAEGLLLGVVHHQLDEVAVPASPPPTAVLVRSLARLRDGDIGRQSSPAAGAYPRAATHRPSQAGPGRNLIPAVTGDRWSWPWPPGRPALVGDLGLDEGRPGCLPTMTWEVQVSLVPARTGARKLTFISTLAEKTLRSCGPGDGGRPHGRITEGGQEAALERARPDW